MKVLKSGHRVDRERLERVLFGLTLLVALCLAVFRDDWFGQGGSDLRIYLKAGALAAKGGNPYLQEYFIYPPLAVPIFLFESSRVLHGLLQLVALFFLLFASRELGREINHWAVFPIIGLLFLYTPLEQGMSFSNLSVFVGGMVCASALCLRRGWGVGAGVFLGIAIGLKLTPFPAVGVLGLRAAMTRDWISARAALVALLIVIATFLFLPWTDAWLEYGLPACFEQGIRLSGHSRLWIMLGSFAQPVRIGVALGMVGIWIAARGWLEKRGRERDLLFAATASTVLSPLVWGHTLVVAFPVVIILFLEGAALLKRSETDMRRLRGVVGLTAGSALTSIWYAFVWEKDDLIALLYTSFALSMVVVGSAMMLWPMKMARGQDVRGQ